MKHLFKIIPFILITVLLFSCKNKRLGNATREDKNGWIYVHLSGSPADIGYQHGYLVAKEIDTLIKVFQFYLPHTSGKDWAFYRAAVKRFMWNKIDKEYQDEIKGIAEGLHAKGFKYDSLDITALNANIELSSYYVPWLKNRLKPHSDDNK